jgi:hypothetical protein
MIARQIRFVRLRTDLVTIDFDYDGIGCRIDPQYAPLILLLRFEPVVFADIVFAEDDKRKDQLRAATLDAPVDAIARGNDLDRRTDFAAFQLRQRRSAGRIVVRFAFAFGFGLISTDG